MRPKPYNPCADGFAAKAWECLRRNQSFKEALGGYPEYDRYGEACGWYCNTDITDDMLPFHREALVMLNGYDPALAESNWLSDSDISQSWKMLPEEFRNRLDDALMRHGAVRFLVPSIETISPFPISKSYSESQSRQFFGNLDEYLKTHELIAVPKFVWDTAHIKVLTDEFEKLLSKPMGNVKLLKPTGSTLGSEAQWGSYLLFEEWTQEGYGRGRACGLVAWEKYEAKNVRQNFGKNPKARKQAAADFLATSIGKKQPEKKDTVEGHVALIEKAINSVFPVFAPFDSKK